MNLSRAAKLLRAKMPQAPEPPKRVEKKKLKTPPAPAPVPVPEPVVAVPAPIPQVAAVPTPPPPKTRPVKTKRPRFVREKTEKRQPPAAPALPQRSTKATARLLTQKLALPPKEEGTSGWNTGR